MSSQAEAGRELLKLCSDDLEGTLCCPRPALRSGCDLVGATLLWPTSAGVQLPSLQNNVSWCSAENSCFILCPVDPGSGSRQQRQPSSVSSVPSLQPFAHWWDSPEPSLWAAEPQCSQLFPAGRMVLFLEHLPGSWLHILQYVHGSPVLRSPQYPRHGLTNA